MILRDENDEPFGITLNEQAFYYIKNLQGDVVRVVDSDGVTVLDYFYDAWGNITFEFGADLPLAVMVWMYNPITYRGYYFDAESGMYYLQSRYYNPEWCKFLNADNTDLLPFLAESDNVLDDNFFAYCTNNPVMYYDPIGELAVTTIFIIGFSVIGAVAGGVAGYKLAQYYNVTNGKWKYILSGIVFGGAVGALLGWGTGIAVSAASVKIAATTIFGGKVATSGGMVVSLATR